MNDSKPTQEEIDAAQKRWDEHASRGPALSAGVIYRTVLLLVATVIAALFAPTDPAVYEEAKATAKAWGQRAQNYAMYRVPCMAPESSFVGKWVSTQKVECNKL